jgi:hypothetical protein
MRLIEFSPSAQGSRVGFCKIELPNGLTINGVHVHRGPLGTPFALLPGAPHIDRDGMQKRDLKGNRMWRPILRWRNKALQEGWSAKVVELVRAAHPGAFRDSAA